MRVGFSLRLWTELYTRRLCPIVKVEKVDGTVQYERLTDLYNRVHNLLYGDDVPFTKEVQKKYREELLGPDLIAAVPEEYSTLALEQKFGYETWHSMTLKEKGKRTAYAYLQNIEELIKEHMRAQKRKIEQRKNRLQ